MTISNTTIETIQFAALPDDFTVRAAQMSDLEAVVDMFNEAAELENHHEKFSYDNIRSEWEQPNFDLETQTQIVLSPENKIAAYVEVHIDMPTRMRLWHRVHPDFADTTVGLYLLQWAEATVRDHVDKAPKGARVVLHGASRPDDVACEERFAAIGMETVRRFYKMRIDMTEAPEVPALPEGISLRNYRHPEDLRATLRADLDAFQDHWGFVEPDFEDEVAYIRHIYDADTLFDPELNVLAIDDATGEIAGLILSRIQGWEDNTVGYVGSLGVLRDYRGRGLGTTLLKLIFKRMFEKGQPSVALGVDASSLTGATRLYEKAGMYVHEVHTVWEKVLRDGVDTMTRDLTDE